MKKYKSKEKKNKLFGKIHLFENIKYKFYKILLKKINFLKDMNYVIDIKKEKLIISKKNMFIKITLSYQLKEKLR